MTGRTRRWLQNAALGAVMVIIAACSSAPEIARTPDESAPPIPSSTLSPPVVVADTSDIPGESPSTDSSAPTTESEPDDADLVPVCNGIPLPGDGADLSSLPPMGEEGDLAWTVAADLYGVDLRGDGDWRILDDDGVRLTLITADPIDEQSRSYGVASFERTGDSFVGSSYGSCHIRLGVAGRVNTRFLEVDEQSGEDPDAPELHLLFEAVPGSCGPGAIIDPRVVEQTGESVSIVLTILPKGDGSCGPDSFQRVTVPLDEPLEGRDLFDVSWMPPRQLFVFDADKGQHVVFAGSTALGWYDDELGWVDHEPALPWLPIPRGTEFQVVDLDGAERTAVSGSIVADCEIGGTWTVEFDPPIEYDEPVVAVDGEWPVIPRPVDVLDPTIPDYTAAVRAFLDERGLRTAPVNVTQVVRADLDGDGTAEVLVVASNLPPSGLGARAGDYTIVLLRRVAGSGVDTTVLFEDLHETADTELPSWASASLFGIADLNGDGVMEVVLDTGYYEGGGHEVYDLVSGAPEKVLTGGCGA
jgi:hypothetical protein